MRRSRTPLCALALLCAAAIPSLAHAAAPPASAVAPGADAFVTARHAKANYGSSRHLRVSRRPARRAYLRFDLSARVPGSRVRLYLYPLTSTSAGLRIRSVHTAPWDEGGITYRRLPRSGRQVVRTGTLRAHRWKVVDVTRLVGRRGVVSLLLTARGRRGAVLASREARTGAPRVAFRAQLQAQAPPPAAPTVAPVPVPPAPLPGGPPLWRGDFETDDFAQWKQLDGNLALKDRYFGIVSSPQPVAQGRYAFRSTVDGNARVSGEAGQRSMVLLFPERVPQDNQTGAFEGSERWYHTHIYFPLDFRAAPNNSWNWLVQWHNWPNGPCCSNVAIYVDTRGGADSLSMRVMGGGDSAHPAENNDIITERNPAGHLDTFVGDRTLHRGHWYDSVTHVKWSADPAKGLVEWWLDGHLIASKVTSTLYWYRDNNSATPGATPGPGQAYYMEGYYRPDTLPNGTRDLSTATVYFDGAELGPTEASVSGP